MKVSNVPGRTSIHEEDSGHENVVQSGFDYSSFPSKVTVVKLKRPLTNSDPLLGFFSFHLNPKCT